MKTFLTILITLIVAGGAAGAGMYYYDKSKCDDAKKKLSAEVKSAESSCPSSEATSSSASSEGCTVYSYSNTTYGISFDYPKNWLIEGRENKAPQGALLSFMLNDTPVLQDTDMPPAIAIYLYDSISKLDEEGLGATDLKDYLDKSSGGSASASYKNVVSATVAEKSGYSADDAGNGMFEDSKYYFVEVSGGKILKIWDQAESADTKIVVDSTSI
jgi:hypothetical protein